MSEAKVYSSELDADVRARAERVLTLVDMTGQHAHGRVVVDVEGGVALRLTTTDRHKVTGLWRLDAETDREGPPAPPELVEAAQALAEEAHVTRVDAGAVELEVTGGDLVWLWRHRQEALT